VTDTAEKLNTTKIQLLKVANEKKLLEDHGKQLMSQADVERSKFELQLGQMSERVMEVESLLMKTQQQLDTKI
jgi:hypothetical protein